MAGKSRKRVNPNKVPISKAEVNLDRLINEAGAGKLYFAWLLLLPTLCGYDDMAGGQLESVLNAANAYVTHPLPAGKDMRKETRRVEELIGRGMPHPHIDLDRIQTKGDMAAVNRKLRENALHSALCLICMGLEATGRFSETQLRHLFLNADLTLAEIESGHQTYRAIVEKLRGEGILFAELDRYLPAENE